MDKWICDQWKNPFFLFSNGDEWFLLPQIMMKYIVFPLIFCQLVANARGPVSMPVSRNKNTAQYSSSGLADFFQEPKLGTTWYNPNGPTPTFDMKQENATVFNARLGSEAFMSCKVSYPVQLNPSQNMYLGRYSSRAPKTRHPHKI